MFSHKYGPVSPNHPWFTPLISAFMFSFLAWPRTIIFTLILSTLAEAREESLCESHSLFTSLSLNSISLVTSSVTYCSPPETLLIQRFEVAYFPSNSSVAFNVSASSVVCTTCNFHMPHSSLFFRNPASMLPQTYSSTSTARSHST